MAVGDDQVVPARRHHTSQRSKCLRVTEDALALCGIAEELGQPGDGGDKFNADADEAATAPEQEPFDRRRVASRQGGKGVDEDAPHEDTTAAEQVGEVAADQPEDASRNGG